MELFPPPFQLSGVRPSNVSAWKGPGCAVLPCGFGGLGDCYASACKVQKTVGLWRGDRRPEVAETAMLISERKHHVADSRWSSRLAFSSVLIFICYLSVPARVSPSDPTHSTRTQPKLRQARPNISNCTHIEHVNPVHGKRCIVIRAQREPLSDRCSLSYPLPYSRMLQAVRRARERRHDAFIHFLPNPDL